MPTSRAGRILARSAELTQTFADGVAEADVTNSSLTVTLQDNEIVKLIVYGSDGGDSGHYISVDNNSAGNSAGRLRIYRDATILSQQIISTSFGNTSSDVRVPPFVEILDQPGAGTYTYKLTGECPSDPGSANFNIIRARFRVEVL